MEENGLGDDYSPEKDPLPHSSFGSVYCRVQEESKTDFDNTDFEFEAVETVENDLDVIYDENLNKQTTLPPDSELSEERNEIEMERATVEEMEDEEVKVKREDGQSSFFNGNTVSKEPIPMKDYFSDVSDPEDTRVKEIFENPPSRIDSDDEDIIDLTDGSYKQQEWKKEKGKMKEDISKRKEEMKDEEETDRRKERMKDEEEEESDTEAESDDEEDLRQKRRKQKSDDEPVTPPRGVIAMSDEGEKVGQDKEDLLFSSDDEEREKMVDEEEKEINSEKEDPKQYDPVGSGEDSEGDVIPAPPERRQIYSGVYEEFGDIEDAMNLLLEKPLKEHLSIIFKEYICDRMDNRLMEKKEGLVDIDDVPTRLRGYFSELQELVKFDINQGKSEMILLCGKSKIGRELTLEYVLRSVESWKFYQVNVDVGTYAYSDCLDEFHVFLSQQLCDIMGWTEIDFKKVEQTFAQSEDDEGFINDGDLDDIYGDDDDFFEDDEEAVAPDKVKETFFDKELRKERRKRYQEKMMAEEEEEEEEEEGEGERDLDYEQEDVSMTQLMRDEEEDDEEYDEHVQNPENIQNPDTPWYIAKQFSKQVYEDRKKKADVLFEDESEERREERREEDLVLEGENLFDAVLKKISTRKCVVIVIDQMEMLFQAEGSILLQEIYDWIANTRYKVIVVGKMLGYSLSTNLQDLWKDMRKKKREREKFDRIKSRVESSSVFYFNTLIRDPEDFMNFANDEFQVNEKEIWERYKDVFWEDYSSDNEEEEEEIEGEGEGENRRTKGKVLDMISRLNRKFKESVCKSYSKDVKEKLREVICFNDMKLHFNILKHFLNSDRFPNMDDRDWVDALFHEFCLIHDKEFGAKLLMARCSDQMKVVFLAIAKLTTERMDSGRQWVTLEEIVGKMKKLCTGSEVSSDVDIMNHRMQNRIFSQNVSVHEDKVDEELMTLRMYGLIRTYYNLTIGGHKYDMVVVIDGIDPEAMVEYMREDEGFPSWLRILATSTV